MPVLRDIPSVGKLLESAPFDPVVEGLGRDLVVRLLREILDELRAVLEAAEAPPVGPDRLAPESLAREVKRRGRALLEPAPRMVVNATGVVAHTNLGRSVLSPRAAARVAEAACRYTDLEYEVATGARGHRMAHLAPLLAHLFPGRAALVVNNNAGAILLALRALARNREVVISRGELVEIGGAFRVPEILAASGARMREVGTTNRTRASDYEAAVGPKTGALLKVHTSNFRIVGFTEEVSVEALHAIGAPRGVPVVVDWGSGDLVDLAPAGIHDELPVSKLLEEGADLVTFSGDKLLGGPQAGFVVGRDDLVRRLARDPMARVLRLDRLMIGAIRETLSAYVRGRAFDEIPTLRMLRLSPEAVGRRARTVIDAVAARTGSAEGLTIEAGVSRSGGGSSPVGEVPTRLVVVALAGRDAGPIERELRQGEPPILGRLQDGRLLLDLRTVLEDQDALLAERLAEAVARARRRKVRR